MTFNASAHPRASAGSSTGGQFISYDSSSKHGTGYGKEHGDPRVVRLQKALNRLRLTDAKGHRLQVDGKLGPLTTEAVKAAQRKLGVKADGRVDGDLLKQLEKLAGESGAAMDALIRSGARKKKPAARVTNTAKTAVKTTAPGIPMPPKPGTPPPART
jgi:peptidoglycan hydrolase-like protein with peptidoglycan-binding domain